MRRTIDEGPSRKIHILLKGGAAFAIVILIEQILNFVQVYAVPLRRAGPGRSPERVFAFCSAGGSRSSTASPSAARHPRHQRHRRHSRAVRVGALNAVVDLLKLVGIVVVMVTSTGAVAHRIRRRSLVAVLVTLVRRRSREAFRESEEDRPDEREHERAGFRDGRRSGFLPRRRRGGGTTRSTPRTKEANIASIKYEAFQDAAIEMVTSVCLASIVVSLGYRHVSFGTVVAFNAYLLMFFEPISALAQRYTLLRARWQGRAGVRHARSGLKPTPRASDAALRAEWRRHSRSSTWGSIQAERPVLSDVSFSVAAARRWPWW
jgi:ATP-binding cassette subfamily B protein